LSVKIKCSHILVSKQSESLAIPAGIYLDINFVNNFLRVESGSGFLIKAGGYVYYKNKKRKF